MLLERITPRVETQRLGHRRKDIVLGVERLQRDCKKSVLERMVLEFAQRLDDGQRKSGLADAAGADQRQNTAIVIPGESPDELLAFLLAADEVAAAWKCANHFSRTGGRGALLRIPWFFAVSPNTLRNSLMLVVSTPSTT